jgi:stage V sporulation protein G
MVWAVKRVTVFKNFGGSSMQITEVRIKLTPAGQDRLRGFCSATIDSSFVVRDIKIIDGPNGVFVAMPSRKLMDGCHQCRSKNHLRARFCNNCGAELDENRHSGGPDARMKLHCDVAHPINAQCRGMVQDAIIQAYHEEVERSKQPGYQPQRFDELDDVVPANGNGAALAM